MGVVIGATANVIDFERLMGDVPNPYMVVDRDFRFVWANKAYERATMRSFEEIAGERLFDCFPAPDPQAGKQLQESIQRAFDSGTTDELAFIEYALRRQDGQMERSFWSATHTPIRDASGNVAFVLQHTVNVTELQTLRRERDEVGVLGRARAAEKRFSDVAQELAQLRNLLEQAPGFVAVLTGPEHRFLFANAAYFKLLGQRDFIGSTVAQAVPEVSEQGFIAILDEVFRSGKPYFGERERVIFRDNGEADPRRTYLEFIFQPFRDASGAVSGIFIQGHDVTDEVEANERQTLLINELNHRVKNTLAVVQGLAQQSFGRDSGAKFDVFTARLAALASAHNLLTSATWEAADLRELVCSSLEATAGVDVSRCSVEGPAISLEPQLAVSMAMIVHELTTNAIKYGALSNDTGTISVEWQTGDRQGSPQLVLRWRESGGPVVARPSREGFGARLIRHGLSGKGSVQLDYEPEGVQCVIEAAL